MIAGPVPYPVGHYSIYCYRGLNVLPNLISPDLIFRGGGGYRNLIEDPDPYRNLILNPELKVVGKSLVSEVCTSFLIINPPTFGNFVLLSN